MPTLIRHILILSMALLSACAVTPPELTRRVDFDSHLLLAEIAREGQELQLAAKHYLEASLISEDPSLAELATELSHQLGLSEIGLRAAERWEELSPDATRPHLYLGAFKLRSSGDAAALIEFETFINEASNTEAAISRSIEILSNEIDQTGAINVLIALVESYPDVAEGRYGLARFAMRDNDFTKALENAEQATILRPDWVEAQLLYARTLLITGRIDEALALSERLVEDEASLETRLEYAELLLSSGNGSSAKELLELVLDENPQLPEAIRAMAFLMLTENELEEAKIYFETLRPDARFKNEAFFYLGRIAEIEEQYLQAMRSYSRVTEGNNAIEAQLRVAHLLYTNLDDQEGALLHLREFGTANPLYKSEMLVGQSNILVQLGRQIEAMGILSEELKKNPDDDTLHAARTQLYVLQTQTAIDAEDYNMANRILHDGLDSYPDNVSLRYVQSIVYQGQEKLRPAVTILESLVEEYPNDAGFLNALGYLLTDKMDRHMEAKAYIEKALSTEPDNPAIIDSMGWVLFKLGDYEAALGYLEQAFEMFPDPEVIAHIIDVQWALGEKDKALQIYQEALEKHPESPYLQELKQRISP
jgi:tetratricopeptide (TPR) repeat protein